MLLVGPILLVVLHRWVLWVGLEPYTAVLLK